MIIRKHIFYFFSLILLLTNCKNHLIRKVADIHCIDTSGIYFTYNHNDSVFNGNFSLDITDEDFSSEDDLIINIDKDKPDEYFFVSVKEKKWAKEEVIITIDTENKDSYYSYHDVDSKPIFATAKDEFENDSAIRKYFLKDLKVLEKNIKMIGVYILINGEGKVRLKQAMTKNINEMAIIKDRINKMPKFTPAYNGKDTVTVNYLIEIPIIKE